MTDEDGTQGPVAERQTSDTPGDRAGAGSAAAAMGGGSAGRLKRLLANRPALRLGYRIGIAVIGGAVLGVGIVLVPYPGPGWLVVFLGLAILATEFRWAARLQRLARRQYDAWTAWLRRQRLAIRLLVLGTTGVVVLATLWLVDAFGVVAGWFGLPWTWPHSPFSTFSG